jgi:Flp pilus assembly protein TadG
VTVELVAMTPVILVALVFSFEFGRALWAYDVMTRDVRDATRYLSRYNGDIAVNGATLGQTVAETGSATGTQLHFPWNTGTAEFDIGMNSVNGVTVYRLTASLPVNLSLLEAMNSFLQTDTIQTGYTLVVWNEFRQFGE